MASSTSKSIRCNKRIMGEIKRITTEYNDVYNTIDTSTGKIKLKLKLQNDNIRHWRIYVHKDNFKNVEGLYKDLEIISYPVAKPVADPPKTYPAASVVSS